jgi:putative ABC transport system permease protein
VKRTTSERTFLGAHGTVSVVATLPTMAHTADGRATLVEVKAVDHAYPLSGTAATDPNMPLPELFAQQGDAFGAAADPALLARLDLQPGDRITIGNAVLELRAALTNEPDKLAGGIGLGPRLLTSDAALRASGLLQPGSLVRWQYRLRLPATASSDSAVASIENRRGRNSRMPAGTSARATRPRRSLNAMSSGSANSSRSSP